MRREPTDDMGNGQSPERSEADLKAQPPAAAIAGNGADHGLLDEGGSGNLHAVIAGIGPVPAKPASSGHSKWGKHQMYRYLFENHSEPMWIYELETLRFLEVNDAAIRRYGYSHEEFLAMTLRDIRTPEILTSPARPGSRVHVLSQSGPSIHRAKDGSLIKGEITSLVLSFGNRRPEW
jgi:PAS domain S-box-containing protein